MKIEMKIAILIVILLTVSLASARLSNYVTVSGTVTLLPSSTTLTLYSTSDSPIEEINPNDNYGSSTYLRVKSNSDDNKRSLVKFDISSIPSTATITSAKLYLYYYEYSYGNPSGRDYWTYRVTSSWLESEVTWNKRDNIETWSMVGGDYTTTDGVSITMPSSFGWVSWDVTNIVSSWHAGLHDNNGFLIKDGSESASGDGYQTRFRSNEYEGLDYDPYLVVTYTG